MKKKFGLGLIAFFCWLLWMDGENADHTQNNDRASIALWSYAVNSLRLVPSVPSDMFSKIIGSLKEAAPEPAVVVVELPRKEVLPEVCEALKEAAPEPAVVVVELPRKEVLPGVCEALKEAAPEPAVVQQALLLEPEVLTTDTFDSIMLPEVAKTQDTMSKRLEFQEQKPPEPEVRGVVLLGPKDVLLTDAELKEVCLLEVKDLTVPGGIKALRKRIYERFVGETLTSEMVFALKADILRYYEEEDRPFVEVQIPSQDITSGVVQFIVSESHVSDIDIEGGRYTSVCDLKRYLSTNVNDVIDLGQLRKSVNFMNRNPFRRVDVVYGPGDRPLTTDVSLIVEDRRPTRFYTGFDNTGVETTDRQRFFAGINWMFGFDHLFNYQFTSTYKITPFQAHTLQYTSLLPWSHVFTAYGGYSRVHVSLPWPSSRNDGSSYQASFRYTIPFLPGSRFSHEFTFGGDYKRTNNTILYSETFENIAQPVNLTQVMGSYVGAWEGKNYRLDFDIELFWSPGEWITDQSNADYNRLRPEAKHQWVYGKGGLKYLQKIGNDWSLMLWSTLQIASQNLLPSEQLGIGGYDTVRGYDERQLNYDGGIILNGELRTPSFPILGRWSKNIGRDALQFLAFLDFGYGRDHNRIPGSPTGDYLLGAGPGLRYTLNPWLTTRLDWGVKLHREAIFTGGNTMVHFSLNMNI